jgi:hypothetical protein
VSAASSTSEPSGGARLDFAGEMRYGDYVKLDSVLDTQHPRSGDHSELLLIDQHQICRDLDEARHQRACRGARVRERRRSFRVGAPLTPIESMAGLTHMKHGTWNLCFFRANEQAVPQRNHFGAARGVEAASFSFFYRP